MTQNSYRGYVEVPELTTYTTFGADQPVDAYSAWQTRDGIQHMLDQSAQYRVNWAAHLGNYADQLPAASYFSGSLTPQTLIYTFPITTIRPDRPMQLDIRIGGIVADGTPEMDIKARIHPFKSPDALLWEATDSTASTSAVWVIDELATWTAEQRHKLGKISLLSVDNDASSEPATVRVDLVQLRIDYTMDTAEGEGSGYIVGVQVREYP